MFGVFNKIICSLGVHDYIIVKYSVYNKKKLIEEGFQRTCQYCKKIQILARPNKYHPTKYIWVDVTDKTEYLKSLGYDVNKK